MVSATVTLVTIPILIGEAGADAWAALAVGQAVGTGAAILIGFGWGTTGPTEVAKADAAGRVRIYSESFRARVLLAVPFITAAAVVTVFLTRFASLEASLNAIGFAATGLLAGWFFTGVARPYALLVLDTLPRVVGAAAGATAVVFGAPLLAFPLLQMAGILLGVIASTKHVLGSHRGLFFEAGRPPVLQVIRRQSHGVVLAIVSASYAAVPAAVVAVVSPSGLPAYALVDKLLRFATTAFAPVLQVLQGWVPTGSPADVRRKVRVALLLGVSLAISGCILFILLAPVLAALLSHDEVIPDKLLVVGFGLALMFMVTSQVVGLVCLLALGHGRSLAAFSTISIIVGLPAVVVGALIDGAIGAAWGLAAAEVVAFVPQALLLARVLSR
jgi:O-antigen/teichoic acid export membrane protein